MKETLNLMHHICFMKTHTPKTPHRLANMSLFVWLLFVTAGMIFSSCDGLRPVDNNVDIYMTDATIDAFDMEDIKPSFSWKTKTNGVGWKQGAYRIIVSDSKQSLESGNASVWDSKKRASEEQLFVSYEGEKLVSGKEYYWKVMVWDRKGRPSPWSDHQSFLMPIDYDNDWRGEWITHDYDPEAPMPLFRKSFSLDNDVPVKSAVLYVCGLGYYEAYLNGKKIGDKVLEPAQTNYEDYAFYSVYELEPELFLQDNMLGVMLGNGWFNQHLVWTPAMAYGPPVLSAMLLITLADGTRETIVTDASWLWKSGPITFSNIYAGETYDARLEVPDWCTPGSDKLEWNAVEKASIHPTRLIEQTMEPIRKTGIVPVKRILNPEKDLYVFDMGQNFAGWVRLKIEGEKGQKIVMRFSEEIDTEGHIDPASTGVRATRYVQTSTYICKGEGAEVWEPRFTYHGFRYVEVSGLTDAPNKDMLTGIVVHNDLPLAGTFECSSEQINRLHDMARWTMISNLHSQLTDCPHRERCGWTGDVHAAATSLMYQFNARLFLKKYAYDMRSSGREAKRELYFGEHFHDRSFIIKPEGIPTMIVPGRRTSGTASPDWGTALAQVPWLIYEFYGDTEILNTFYPDIKTWVEFVGAIDEDLLVPHGLGDWCPPGGNENIDTPVALSSSAFHYLDLTILSKIAAILGHEEDAEYYGTWQHKLRERFNEAFYDRENKTYGSQTANAMAIQTGLAPKEDLEAIVAAMVETDDLEGEGFLQTGIFGLGRIFPALAEHGAMDAAYRLFTKTGKNSFSFMWDHYDATTLWEILPVGIGPTEEEADMLNLRSHSHPMQAGYDEWLIRGIAGINNSPEYTGLKKTILRPWFTSKLSYATGSYESPYGPITSHWENTGDQFIWSFEIPANTTADVYVPLFHKGQKVTFTEGIALRQKPETDEDHPEYQLYPGLGSGSYTLVVDMQ